MNNVINPFDVNTKLRYHLTEAIIAQGGINHPGLNAYLRKVLPGEVGENGGLICDPVIEAAADYLSSGKKLEELTDLLSEETVRALVGKEGDNHRFDYPAYTHQLDSWQTLLGKEPRSLLVASGTGSGKTECFMVPMLEDLASESREAGGASLTGVRALMLYPLNALIASQKERLSRWTEPFGSRLRYGLYNGQMPVGRAQDIRKGQLEAPSEVRYRKDLRANPPPILVTNNTMLEYMTIRKDDAAILEASAGKLRWIIVDEAHSYIGSSAAELSLLLRRVMLAFKVAAKDVRFVATSATIGDEDENGRAALRRFWADIAGVDPGQVDVVFGTPEPFVYPEPGSDEATVIGQALSQTEGTGNYRLGKDVAQRLREKPASHNEINNMTGGQASNLLAAFAGKGLAKPVLPMRVHKFVRAVPGLWSCLSSTCSGDKPENWGFGALHFELSERCRHCDAKVFEVHSCSDCGEPMLLAMERDGILSSPVQTNMVDEFIDTDSMEFDQTGGENLVSDTEVPREVSSGWEYFIAGRAVEGARQIGINHESCKLSDRSSENGIWMAQAANDPCPVCKGKGSRDTSPYWPWRFGTPFLLQNAAPVVIDGVNPMEGFHKVKLPNEGRQLISFTDSRQGTARLAARIETQSERSFVRMFVYNAVQQANEKIDTDTGQLEEWKKQLVLFERLNITGVAADFLRENISAAEGETTGSVNWSVMVDELSRSPDFQKTIAKVWDREREISFNNEPKCLANFLLMRELGRRPLRGNMIETMGLARLSFSTIEKLTESSLPSAFRNAGRGLDEWKNYLYLIIDQLRGNFALRMTQEEQHWLPGKAYARNIIGPGQIKDRKSDYEWPKAKGSGQETNAVKALSFGLNLDPAEPQDRHIINEVLDAAWNALRPLFSDGDSYALNLKLANIEQVRQGWRCSLSRRIVPRLIFGISPNIVRHVGDENLSKPRQVSFPVLPEIFPKTTASRAKNAAFIETDPLIQELREDGLWSALHDRIAIGSPFIRAEEHSAQQPPWRLRDFERQFKRGEINMLACSTTMEMGVDIGSIEAVINTNVPPSITNYRQRVGRAGRRRQGYAFSLTIARDTPLDRETLRDPLQYLIKKLRAPMVTLDSRPIVQRHANALLLARWLLKDGGQLHRIEAGTFFGYGKDLKREYESEKSPCAQYTYWLRLPSTKSEVGESLKQLTQGTILENDMQILETAALAFDDAAERFGQVWTRLHEQHETVAVEAQSSILFQARRICGEYLLKELANRALIPGSGFPTAVVPFVTDSKFTRTQTKSNDNFEEGGAQGRRYDYPSRNADIAIREYAPGAHVVVDGIVWTSAGVALTWKRPVDSEDVREAQSFRWHWKCSKCGEHGTGHEMQLQCPACGQEGLPNTEYLEPAGFKVDWTAKPNADTDDVSYIEPEDPVISASDGIWHPLLDSSAGYYRTSAIGHVFHCSRGPGKSRYDLCLDCGRAEPHIEQGSAALTDHDALTPLKGQSGRCTGNDRTFAIKRQIALGYEVQTDVAELQLVGIRTQGAALALASALRETLARAIGIETRAIGLGVQRCTGALSEPVWSVLLYDQTSGGAGYVTQLFDNISETLRNTANILDCEQGCEKACSACVLAPDLFAKQEQLERREASKVVQDILARVAEPTIEERAFPDSVLSKPVVDDLIWRMGSIKKFALYMPVDFDLAALTDEPFRSLFLQAERYNVPRALIIPEKLISQSDQAFLLGLLKIAHRFDLQLRSGSAPVSKNKARCIGYFSNEEQITAYFSRDKNAQVPGTGWGSGRDAPITATGQFAPPTYPIIADSVFEPTVIADSSLITIGDRVSHPAAQFGEFFVNHYIKPALQDLGMWQPGNLARVEYSDRYLKAPLPIICALRTVNALKKMLGNKEKTLPLRLLCDQSSNDRSPRLIFHNWQNADDQDAVARNLTEALGLDLEIPDQPAMHARKLTLIFVDGRKAVCFLDQGFGQWKVSGNANFNFHISPARQAAALLDFRNLLYADTESYIAARVE